MGELRHATRVQTTLTVDVRNGRSVVRMDKAHACTITALSGCSGQGILLATGGS